MKKKILALGLSMGLMAVAVVGGTLAYFTDTDDAANTFTVGNVKIDLTEPDWDKEGGGKEQGETVYAYEALPKDPTVENIGANPCFVRVKVTGLDCLKNVGMTDSDIIYETDYEAGALGENWKLHTDGYFYYTKVLRPEETTTDLFEQIRIPADLKNPEGTFTGNNFNVLVNAEAVQAQGAKPSWTDVQNMTVTEIVAWFATCME